jgi:radical SAM protein with 4Fe4S-binding SPASM domain
MLDLKFKLGPGHTSERSWMEPSPLKTLFWNVTYACNYRCPICFTDSGRPGREELSAAEALAVVEKIRAAGIRDILISGGEPFLREGLVEILSRLARHGVEARIATNGSLLGDALLSRLRDETLTKSFQVSLDTAEAGFYERFHGAPAGSLVRVLENVRRVQRFGFHTTISARLTPETLPGIPALLDLAAGEGWPTVTVHLPLHTRRIEEGYPQDADLIALLDPVFEHFAGLPRKWLIETYIPWAGYHPVIRRWSKVLKFVHRGCRAGRDRLTINPGGGLSPCVCLDRPEALVGHVLRDNLVDVFRDSSLCRLLRSPRQAGLCADCALVDECGAGCRAAALSLSGRIDGDDLSCPLRAWRTTRRRLGDRPEP